jgi:hypothetical protein
MTYTIIRNKDRYNIIRYYRNSRLHREDGPAIIYPEGLTFWYKHGKLYNGLGPVEITSDGEVVYSSNFIECNGREGRIGIDFPNRTISI